MRSSPFSPEELTFTEKIKSISWFFIFLIVMVACVGFLSLYSAAGGSMEPWASKQMLRFSLGLSGLFIVAMIDIRWWMKAAYPLFALVVLMLIWVEIKGQIGMGAQRWINLGFMQLQPSELMKIAVVLALARFFHATTADDVKSPVFLMRPLALISVPVVLVLLQPDLGTALKIVMVSGAMFFIAGVSYWIFATIAGLGIAAVPAAWYALHDYQRERVLTFLNPERDPLGAGYHITQSKIALGSGGLTGKGFLDGSQSHLNFLPEKQTDFIFTLFSEEWGLMGGLTLMALFFVLMAYGYILAFQSQNQFGRLVSAGVIINFSLYVFINIGMVMGLLPVVGVPLPLISYGGSVMMSTLFGFGLLMSAYVHRHVKFTRRGLDIAM